MKVTPEELSAAHRLLSEHCEPDEDEDRDEYRLATLDLVMPFVFVAVIVAAMAWSAWRVMR